MARFPFIIGLMLILPVAQASADWTLPAKVRFESGAQYTPWTAAQVTFMTGAELNRAANAFSYNALGGRYAVIPIGDGQNSIVQLSGFAYCTGNFNQTCLPGGRADGFDAQGRHWQICTTPSCL
jgi:hypothetical protein